MEVNIYEAKNKLSELVKGAERGEEVILSRHGRPVAKLVKLQPETRELGLFRGQIKEVDQDWWKPMTNAEAEAFYRRDR